MIVLLNGPFGVGKSTTARLLARRLPDATVYDPEVIGWVIRRAARPFLTVDDYQRLWLWRRLTVWGAWLTRRALRRHLIVPLSVLHPEVLAELGDGLLRADPDVRRVRLSATEETLRRRIGSSPDRAARAWRIAHLPAGLAATHPTLGVEVSTEGRAPSEVADTLVASLAAGEGRVRRRMAACEKQSDAG